MPTNGQDPLWWARAGGNKASGLFDWRKPAPAAAKPRASEPSLQQRVINSALMGTPMAWGPMLVNAQAGLGRGLAAPATAVQAPDPSAMADVKRWAGAGGLPELFDRSGKSTGISGSGMGRGPSVPQAAPAPVVPGQAIAPGPGMGAPAAIVNRPEYARAEENNRAYQQAGGRESYWTANPEIKKAALEGPKATDIGYSERADIKAWMDAQIAKGPDGQRMVDRFLADQERKGLIRRPDPLADAYAGGADAQALQGQPGLGESAKQAPWNSAGQNSVFGQGDSAREYGIDDAGLKPGLTGADALGQRNPNQVFAPTQIPGTESARGSLETAASQAPWATGAPGDLAPGVGNFKTSSEIRGLNLGGANALGSAHATQAAAIRPEPGATAIEPSAPPAEDASHSLLDEYMRRIGGARANGATYSGGVISNGLF